MPTAQPKPDWQRHQEHHETVTRILTETGCLDAQHRMRRWHGPKVIPLLEAAGHSSTDFYTCRCRTA